jgi:hypothetical protein
MCSLLDRARRCQNDYVLAITRVGRFHNATYDEQMEAVFFRSTPFVAGAVHPQYTAALNNYDTYEFDFDAANHSVLVKRNDIQYRVDTVNWAQSTGLANATFPTTCCFLVAMRWRGAR